MADGGNEEEGDKMIKDQIEQMYQECSELITRRTKEIQPLVLGEGSTRPKVMLIGDAPGAKEEEADSNFCGKSHQEVERILSEIGLSSEDVYLTYLVKYRPYQVTSGGKVSTRSINQEEVDLFLPYLEKEIALLNPALIISFGNQVLRALTGEESISVSLEDDQLLVIGILGKSYKLYPMYTMGTRYYEGSFSKLAGQDLERVKQVIANKSRGPFALIRETSNEFVEQTKENFPFNEEVMEEAQKQRLREEREKRRIFDKIVIDNQGDEESKRLKEKTITMIYASEGYVDDPTLVVLNRLSQVFDDLGLTIHRVNLYKEETSLQRIFEYILASKGVILATTVEWFGIGHHLQTFLDDCFTRGEERYFKNVPLLGIVIGRFGYEEEAYHYLIQSWEHLGGCEGRKITAVFKDAAALETNFDLLKIIDRKGEDFFRFMIHYQGELPQSTTVRKIYVEVPVKEYSSFPVEEESGFQEKEKETENRVLKGYEDPIKTEKNDIANLTLKFRSKFEKRAKKGQQTIPEIISQAYVTDNELICQVQIVVVDSTSENTVMSINQRDIQVYFGNQSRVKVIIKINRDSLMRILTGKMTFQRAFVAGKLKAKGDFTLLSKLDQVFDFR